MLLASSNTKLKSLMKQEFIRVSHYDDQENVANIIAQYNYLTIPVINDNILIGIITVNDVVDIIREEASEDILKMAGAGEDREILLKSVWEGAKIRFPRLLASWFGGVLAITIIVSFETLLSNTIALTSFIPIILGMNGNMGNQTSTIIIRGISTERVNLNEVSKVVYKEISIGLLLGCIYGVFIGLLSSLLFFNYTNPFLLSVTVSISIFSAMVIACNLGSLSLILIEKLRFYPAISTDPFVTTSVDVFGVLIYFLVAYNILDV